MSVHGYCTYLESLCTWAVQCEIWSRLVQYYLFKKIEKEIKPMALQPHPFEFGMYYDV